MTVRHTIFQHSLISALAAGVFDDDLTLAELLSHGSFGLGTFNALDGEMIVLDGRCYQMRSDGSISEPELTAKTPYATVTNFVPALRHEIDGPLQRQAARTIINGLRESENYLYAVRITGDFAWVTTRTVARQSEPYPTLVEATDGEDVLRFEHTSGTLAGFLTPTFAASLAVPGDHLHYLDHERTHGGHCIDFEIERGVVELCQGTDLAIRLPLTGPFRNADLAPEDLQQQLSKAEHSD